MLPNIGISGKFADSSGKQPIRHRIRDVLRRDENVKPDRGAGHCCFPGFVTDSNSLLRTGSKDKDPATYVFLFR